MRYLVCTRIHQYTTADKKIKGCFACFCRSDYDNCPCLLHDTEALIYPCVSETLLCDCLYTKGLNHSYIYTVYINKL